MNERNILIYLFQIEMVKRIDRLDYSFPLGLCIYPIKHYDIYRNNANIHIIHFLQLNAKMITIKVFSFSDITDIS